MFYIIKINFIPQEWRKRKNQPCSKVRNIFNLVKYPFQNILEEQKEQVENVEGQASEVDPAMEQRLVNITIVDLNQREIKLKMVQYELILELREFLSEHVYTCFFTNYYLEHQGKKLSDYSDLSELKLNEEGTDNKIYMRA